MAHIIDVVDIDDTGGSDEVLEVVELTQNYGSMNALVPVLSPSLASTYTLDQFVLFVFNSSDWDVGRHTAIYSVASSDLDASGNWLDAPLVIVPGTYHIVIINNVNVTIAIAPYLQVTM